MSLLPGFPSKGTSTAKTKGSDRRIECPPKHVKLNKTQRMLLILDYIRKNSNTLRISDTKLKDLYVKETGVKLSSKDGITCPALEEDIKDMIQLRYLKRTRVCLLTKRVVGQPATEVAYIPDIYFNFLIQIHLKDSSTSKVELPSLL